MRGTGAGSAPSNGCEGGGLVLGLVGENPCEPLLLALELWKRSGDSA